MLRRRPLAPLVDHAQMGNIRMRPRHAPKYGPVAL